MGDGTDRPPRPPLNPVELALQFNHPGMVPGHVEASMRLFAAELLPEIRTWAANPE